MREHHNLYAVLGVTASASAAEIRHGYRAQVRRHHPDTRPTNSNDDHLTQDSALRQVLAAYTVLRDPQKRAAYDRQQPRRPRDPAPVRPGPDVVVLGGSGSTWTGRDTWITDLQAGLALGSREWLLEMVQELGHHRW
jgi:DnaJ-class molecular chaperone